jgi:hypothetical protein
MTYTRRSFLSIPAAALAGLVHQPKRDGDARRTKGQ